MIPAQENGISNREASSSHKLSTLWHFWTSWFRQRVERAWESEFFLRGLILLKMEMESLTLHHHTWGAGGQLDLLPLPGLCLKISFLDILLYVSFIYLKKQLSLVLTWLPWLRPTVLPFSFSWYARCWCSHLTRWGHSTQVNGRSLVQSKLIQVEVWTGGGKGFELWRNFEHKPVIKVESFFAVLCPLIFVPSAARFYFRWDITYSFEINQKRVACRV